MKKINWVNVRLLIIFMVVLFLYSFSSVRNQKRKISEPAIEFLDNETIFITHKELSDLIKKHTNDFFSIQRNQLDISQIEKLLDQNKKIEKAEVYFTIDGILKVEIKQKIPVARVFNNLESYYIDYNGNEMPLFQNYTVRVPLVFGTVTYRNKDDFKNLLRTIHDDDFLHKNIIGIKIASDGTVRMTNRNYDYEIYFGKMTRIEKKFNNYKAFFQVTIQDNTINKYKKVNLNFTQQVVCTKK